MNQKCTRPHPRAGARPQKESNAGANDKLIVTVRRGTARPLPAELLELADRIADRVVAQILAGGVR